MTALASLAALIGALAVVVIPGGAILIVLRPAAGIVSALALAPATSLGLASSSRPGRRPRTSVLA